MYTLVATNEFIVRHVLSEALDKSPGLLTCGSETELYHPFNGSFSTVFISLKLKHYNVIEIVKTLKEINPEVKIIGLYPRYDRIEVVPGVFDGLYEEPWGHIEAKEILKDFFKNERMVNGIRDM